MHGLNDLGIGSSNPGRIENFSISSRPAQGSPSLLSSGYRQLFPGVKRQGREADHSPTTSSEVKKKCGSTHPLPHTSSWP
jgi:hypothetical protein